MISSEKNAQFLEDTLGYSFRDKNGLAYEHTLYTTGEKLLAGFEKAKFRIFVLLALPIYAEVSFCVVIAKNWSPRNF